MYSTRLLQLLFTGLAFASLTQAGAKYDSDGLMIPRQEDADGPSLTILPDDGGDDNPSATESPPASSTTEAKPPPSSTPTEDPDPSTTTTEDKPPATTTKDTTTKPPTETTTTDEKPTTTSKDDVPSSTTSKPDPSTTEDNNDEEEEATTSEKPIISTAIETITRTNSDGSKETLTTSTITTHSPEPQDGDDANDGGGGLNDDTRKIVIGVCVGVGGAILLGALALVYWRIRNRKKQAEENEGLMEYNAGYTGPGADKMEPPGSAATGTGTTVPTSSGGGRSPFQSTLDTYHQPTPPVNASSNF